MNSNTKKTTHNFLHERGLIVLKNDLDNIFNILKSDTNITEKHIKLVRSNYEHLYEMKNIYVQYANEPDKVENKCYFEKYEFIPNWGMRVHKIKYIPLPFAFSQHFYSPQNVSNYIQSTNKVIELMCQCKWKLIRDLGLDIKKQGLTFNAMELFRIHARNAAILAEKNNYKLNVEIIKELSYASHYLEDLCETHHATNKIGLGCFSFLLRIKPFRNKNFKRLSNHSDFEKYAFRNKEKHIVTSAEQFCNIKSLREEEKIFWKSYAFYDNFFNIDCMVNTSGTKCFEKICHWNALYSNCFAAGICDYYDVSDEINEIYKEKVEWALSYDKKDWDKNIEQTLKLAQISVSVFLFNFLLYISDHEKFDFINQKKEIKN